MKSGWLRDELDAAVAAGMRRESEMDISDDHLKQCLTHVAEMEAEEGDFKVEEHVCHLASERIEILTVQRDWFAQYLVGLLHDRYLESEVQEALVIAHPQPYSELLAEIIRMRSEGFEE